MLFSKTGKPEGLPPPTDDALHFHLMQVHYQVVLWKIAHCAILELSATVEVG